MNDAGMLHRLWPHVRPDWGAFLLAVALTPATAALGLVQPWLLKEAIDGHIVPGVAEGLGALALLFLGVVAAGYVLEGVYVLALAWGGQRTIVRLRSAVYRHLLSLRQSYLDRQPAGRLLTRAASDIDAVLGLGSGEGGDDALYDQAVAIVVKDRKCSTSYIQRKLGIGYNKAARLVEQMEDQGVVTRANHVGKREILIEER